MKPTERFSPLQGDVTTYDIGWEVVRLAREEPRRLWMDHWSTMFRRDISEFHPDWVFAEGIGLPQCGTVLCEAGWICAIAHPFQLPRDIEHTARYIMLGRDDYDVDEDGYQWGIDTDHNLRLRGLTDAFLKIYTLSEPGTAEYVEEMLAPFIAWMNAHEEFLRNRIVHIE